MANESAEAIGVFLVSDALRLWTFSDAHVGTDKRSGRSSLAEAISQSEGRSAQEAPGFDWDLALDLGDMSGAQHLPTDDEGAEIARQFGMSLRDHAREQIYDLGGNHDRGSIDDPVQGRWWNRWLDPLGVNPEESGVDAANRPYPVTGTWERYSFRVGNVLFLMMSDINEPSQRPGRDTLGGNPGGVVSRETFEWWRSMVDNNQENIIVSAHHYVLRETTVASGRWEGVRRTVDGGWESYYHGYKPEGTPEGASYLYWVGGIKDAGLFETYLEENPGAVDIWLGGHTHTNPDDRHGGRSHIERRWGVWFANISALTRYHGRCPTPPMSRVWTFDGSSVSVDCYLHTDHHAPRGWYQPAARTLGLGKSFHW